ncbi:MAG: anaerobic glycerol-3-phosphate dehydrogenase subunit C [Ardenticatenaceae bacterium]|nr:anaerobic glycerol-3-phosphate dehydrogenase subunit C [Ardenticatenaceae bacterium]
MSLKPIWQAQTEIEFEQHRPVELTLDRCIKCNICVSACPVTAVTDLFPGPKYEAPQAGRFRQNEQETPDHSVDYCSGCRVCNMVCPTGVRIAEINARARGDMVAQRKVSVRDKLRNNLLGRPELLGRVGQPLATLANVTLQSKLGSWLAEKTLGIARNAPMPSFSRRKFSHWLKQHKPPTNATRKVVYFHGCSTEYYEPRVGRAAVHVLEANGFEVLIPPQNCCGLPLLSNGEFAAARAYHQSNIDKLLDYVKSGYVIVGTSTSCTLTLKEEAPELLDFYSEEAQLLAANTYDINEFLLLLHDEGELRTDGLRPIPLTLPYHPPCQYRAHRIGRPAVDLLDLIPELKIIESQVACCGVAGTYGYKQEKYEIAMAVGRPLFDFIHETKAPFSVCDSETCRWQITRATHLPSVHPVELLALAYGFPAEAPLS